MGIQSDSQERTPSKTGPGPTTPKVAPIQHSLHWEDLPEWMRIDPYIQRGYRRQLDSHSACFWSLFYPHNEFVNVWSHLLPAILYLGVMIDLEWGVCIYDYPTNARQTIRREHAMVVQVYIAGTVICLLASAIFHGISAHSEAVAQKLLKLDYVGICFSICVTNISSTYFGLYYSPGWQKFYNTFCILCAITLLVSLMGPNSDGPGAAWFRVFTFLVLMLSGFVPIAHMFLVEGYEGIRHFPLLHTACMEMLYFVGTVFYLSHWPERQWPETFDIWGASHQIFHILVATGQFVFFLGLKQRLT